MSKGGRIIRMRVPPQDCMSVLDGIVKLGLDMNKLSFDAATRIVLSALLEGARKDGVLPQREGFEYLQMMRDHLPPDRMPHKLKLQATLVVDNALMSGLRSIPTSDPGFLRRKARYAELQFKQKQDPLNFAEDMKDETHLSEWQALCMEFYDTTRG